jgi:type IV pilus assembly protein PilB
VEPPAISAAAQAHGQGAEGSGSWSATSASAMSDVYRPESTAASTEPTDLGELLLSRGVVTAEKLNIAQNVLKQSPGRSIREIRIEGGADEAGVQQAVAQLAGVPFERIDLDKGLDGGFDGKLLQRITPEFARERLVMPLRIEGQRAVVGATRPDDVFLVDEIRQRLGVAGVKLVIVTAFDVKGALEIVGEAQQEEVDLSSILNEVEEVIEKWKSKENLMLSDDLGN